MAMNSDRIEGTAREMGGKLERAAGNVVGDGDTQASGVVRQIAGKAQDIYGQVKDSIPDVTGVTDAASDYAGTAYDRGDHYARRGMSLARREIEQYPLSAVLLVGAVGYLLAMLLHGRR
jgi:uncharacterized protein YjbJ (UPF0337 family)